MATGLAFPVRNNTSGGMALCSGTEQDESIIALALADDSNDNAFQQNEGLGSDMIFDVADPLSRAGILARLRRVFNRFEALKRFKLREETIVWNEGDGEMTLEFKYISLEADEEKEFRKTFSSATDGAGGSQSSNG